MMSIFFFNIIIIIIITIIIIVVINITQQKWQEVKDLLNGGSATFNDEEFVMATVVNKLCSNDETTATQHQPQ